MSQWQNDNIALLENEDDTKAGNYFVANYPPFSFWSPDHLDDAVEALQSPPAPDTPLGLYVHIPFCRKRCHFCYFKVYTDRNAEQITRYMDAVISEMRMYAEQAFVDGRTPKFVYFGGGTPSYLSDKQLAYLTDGLKEALPWDGVEEVAFECEPGTLNEKKLKAVRDFGVTRLSLGIENFQDDILKLNNRAHESKQVFKAYEEARRVGFPQINIDLISGMLGETEENWQSCVRKTIELDPECVTIYQMEVPFNTSIYKQMKDEGKLTAPVATWSTKRRWVADAFSQLEDAGYSVTSAYTAVKNLGDVKFVYRDALWAGADMIAVGVSSFGHISRTHMQNEANIDRYIDTVESGKLPVYRALRITDEQQMLREFILQNKLGEVDRDYFIDKFGVNVFDRFEPILAELESHKLVSFRGNNLIWSRKGLLQVDRFLHLFFLPEHRDARYT